jgi:hypothetical protein
MTILLRVSVWLGVCAVMGGTAFCHGADAGEVRDSITQMSRRLTGPRLAGGVTAMEAATSFCTAFTAEIGVTPQELEFTPWTGTDDFLMPLMIDRATGASELAAVQCIQVVDGVPVIDRRLVLTLRHDATGEWRVVHSNPDVRPTGLFRVTARQRTGAPPGDATQRIRTHLGRAEVTVAQRGLAVWTGTTLAPHDPVLVHCMHARSEDGAWRVLVDAATGEVLDSSTLIHTGGIDGQANGVATTGVASAECNEEAEHPLPFVRIDGPSGTTFADDDGMFSVAEDVATVSLFGQWFHVFSFASPELSAAVTPRASSITFNDANVSEDDRAQVNAYLEANRVRSFLLDIHPAFPGLSDGGFTVNVNRTDMTCPRNAWYNADDVSINFCRAGGGFPNTAWSTLVHHEFGHHAIQMAGSGQGEYGEGMSDTIAVLLADDPRLGDGLDGVCGVSLRNADNTVMFPCNNSIHFCGQMLSGAVWDLRTLLRSEAGDDALLIARRLAVNSILLHTGGAVDSSIYLDFLVLDDDDGDLSNGTPHERFITQAFANHNLLPSPPPSNDACESSIEVTLGTVFGDNTHASPSFVSTGCGNSSAADVWYRYTPAQDGLLDVTAIDASFQPTLSLHTDCPPTADNLLACNDTGCSNLTARVVSPVAGNVPVYLRISGCQGARGTFSLMLQGAPLSVELPEGVPDFAKPGTPTIIPVHIADGIDPVNPDTAMMRYRFGAGPFRSLPLIAFGDDLFHAVLPAATCQATPEFYFTAADIMGREVREPADDDGVLRIEVADVTTLWIDSFETDRDWSATAIGATNGFWERGAPVNDPEWPFTPMTDFDGSGQCYLTGNQPGNSDVDDGAVRLTSPALNLTGGNIAIRYRYFLRKEDIVSADRVRTEISVNGTAGPWISVRNHTADTDLQWTVGDIRQSELNGLGVSPGFSSHVRFTVFDFDSQSLVEAGLDAFEIARVTCADIAICRADCVPPGGDGVVNMDDLIAVIAALGEPGGYCDVTPIDDAGTPGNGIVNIDDVVATINQFGACAR